MRVARAHNSEHQVCRAALLHLVRVALIYCRSDGAHQRMLYSLRRRQRFQASGTEPGLLIASSIDRPLQIVDSIMALFRTDYSGRGELSERQQKVRALRPGQNR